MEYLDLTPYKYFSFPLPMLTVGWLGAGHGAQDSGAPPMTAADLRTLRAASRRRGMITLGWHSCDFCPRVEDWLEGSRSGNGEYHYYGRDGNTYAAPVMIMHYVEVHAYRLPLQVRQALTTPGELPWDGRAERLAEVLLAPSADMEWRAEAAIDLAHWHDPRALAALRQAAYDEELISIAGHDVGISIGMLLSFDFASGLRTEDLPLVVREGITEALRHPAQDEHPAAGLW
ncbi:hypothetical protein AB0H83_49420 [Dactylosporangium sp. NPDC050688]|uniref:DUF7919 family protein n=1 Tax=Dactylosporangium sp. NPDC050688 TaxID=3157217 RepID=UPI0033C9AA8D